jgi:hypothetical protein
MEQHVGRRRGIRRQAVQHSRCSCGLVWIRLYVFPYFCLIELLVELWEGCGWVLTDHGQRPKTVKKNTINYHLSRMYPNIVGPRKRK